MQSVRDPSDPVFCTDAYRNGLKNLERSIKLTPTTASSSPSHVTGANNVELTEMYKLVTLIYLERCGGNVLGESAKIKKLSDRAFALLDETNTCNSPFILFILGCEALTDARRLQILRLMSKAEDGHVRNVSHARDMVRFVWVQEDLGTKACSYVSKMQHIFSTCKVVPTFL